MSPSSPCNAVVGSRPSGGSSGRTGLSTGVGLSSAGGAGGGAGARGPSTPSRPTSATATGAVGRHGYGMNSPSRSGYGGYGAAGGRPSYGAPSYGGSGYGRPSYGGTGYGGYNRPATTSVMSSTSSSADPYSGGGSKSTHRCCFSGLLSSHLLLLFLTACCLFVWLLTCLLSRCVAQPPRHRREAHPGLTPLAALAWQEPCPPQRVARACLSDKRRLPCSAATGCLGALLPRHGPLTAPRLHAGAC